MHHQCSCNCHALLLSAGELPRPGTSFFPESNSSQQDFCLRLCILSAAMLHLHRRQNDIPQNGLMWKKIITLKYHSDFLPHLTHIFSMRGNRLPIQQHFSAVNCLQAVQATQKCAFTATGWSQQHYNFSFSYLQVNSV